MTKTLKDRKRHCDRCGKELGKKFFVGRRKKNKLSLACCKEHLMYVPKNQYMTMMQAKYNKVETRMPQQWWEVKESGFWT